jgi:hypothetical protein
MAFAYSATVRNDFFLRNEFSNREYTLMDTNEKNLIRVHSRLFVVLKDASSPDRSRVDANEIHLIMTISVPSWC